MHQRQTDADGLAAAAAAAVHGDKKLRVSRRVEDLSRLRHSDEWFVFWRISA